MYANLGNNLVTLFVKPKTVSVFVFVHFSVCSGLGILGFTFCLLFLSVV